MAPAKMLEFRQHDEGIGYVNVALSEATQRRDADGAKFAPVPAPAHGRWGGRH